MLLIFCTFISVDIAGTLIHSNSFLEIMGLTAGYSTAYTLDRVIDAQVPLAQPVLKILVRLSAEVGIGVATFLIGYKLGLIKLYNNLAYYHPRFSKFQTSFHLGFSAREVYRCGTGAYHRLNFQLTFDDIYGLLHATSVLANTHDLFEKK